MFDPPPEIEVPNDNDRKKVPLGQRRHKIATNQLQNAVAGFNLTGLKCPGATEEPETCGCGANTLKEAEDVTHQTTPPNVPVQVTDDYLVFNPAQKGDSIAFTIPNPEVINDGKTIWYNLKIKTLSQIANGGSFTIGFIKPNNAIDRVLDRTKKYDSETVAVVTVSAKKDAVRLTEFRRVLGIKRDGLPIKLILTAKTPLPIAFDYFQFYRAADQGF
jgi:hypothetical protein